MQADEFVSAVKESTGLPDQQSADRAVRATLAVLGQRLSGGEAKDLAAQLPGGMKEQLPTDGPGEKFDVEDFYQRVADHEGGDVTVSQARQHARATAKALEAALTGGEWNDFISQLPKSYDDLLSTDPIQHH